MPSTINDPGRWGGDNFLSLFRLYLFLTLVMCAAATALKLLISKLRSKASRPWSFCLKLSYLAIFSAHMTTLHCKQHSVPTFKLHCWSCTQPQFYCTGQFLEKRCLWCSNWVVCRKAVEKFGSGHPQSSLGQRRKGCAQSVEHTAWLLKNW